MRRDTQNRRETQTAAAAHLNVPNSPSRYVGVEEWRGAALVSLLLRTSIKLQNTFDRSFLKFGLTAQEAAMLIHCADVGEISGRELAQAMGRDKSKITRFVDRLEAHRYLTKRTAENDRRRLIIRLTKRGSRIAPQLKELCEDVRKQFFSEVLNDDIERLETVLSRLCANAAHLGRPR
jgi:DNA-binding MarR family transcriptional regulator